MIRVTPTCCEEVNRLQTVFIAHKTSYDLNSKVGWYAFTFDNEMELHRKVSVAFCPHCATKLPEIELNPDITDKKICSITDGGYYCDTCKKRLMSCTCLPPTFRYRPKA